MVLSGDYLFAGLIILGGLLTLIAIKVNMIVMRLAAAGAWLVLAVLLLSNSLSTPITNQWTQILGYVFVLLTFVPLLMQIGSKTQISQTNKEGMSWSTYSSVPKVTPKGKKKKPSVIAAQQREADYRLRLRQFRVGVHKK